MKPKRPAGILIRLEDTERARLQAIADATHDTPAGLAYKATCALIEAYDRDGYLVAPLRFAAPPMRSLEGELQLTEPAIKKKPADLRSVALLPRGRAPAGSGAASA